MNDITYTCKKCGCEVTIERVYDKFVRIAYKIYAAKLINKKLCTKCYEEKHEGIN